MIEDAELLRRYAEEGTEEAFAEFVQRRVDFVYACALRRVGGDAHAAEDVTQQVFVAAARDARRLALHPVVTGWLYTATRNVSAQLVRTERRRAARELEAQAMDSTEDEKLELEWARLRPVLDDALDTLAEDDRQAVLLRFFEGKSFAEVGERLRLGENAARMRVSRALEKLSAALSRRGVTSTAAALSLALAAQPAAAVPAGLAAAVTGAALAGGVAEAVIFMGMTKLQLGVVSALMTVGAVGYVVQAGESSKPKEPAPAPAAALQADNQALRQQLKEKEEANAAKTAELARVKAQQADARAKLAEIEAAKQAEAAKASRAPGTRLYDLRELDRAPQARVRPAPAYPAALRKAGTQGEAFVDFIVDENGAVQNAQVLKATHPDFGAAAVNAVEKWRFTPGEKGGRAVATHMQVPIVFTVNDSK